MKIDFTEPIKENIQGQNFKDVEQNPIVPADQLANLVYLDRGQIAKTAKEAYQLNSLMERISCSEGAIEINDRERKLLEKVLDAGLKNEMLNSFLAGRLYGLISQDNDADKKLE